VVADVDTITWPVELSVPKLGDGARKFGGCAPKIVNWGVLKVALAPAGRPVTDRLTPIGSICEVLVTA
jgi:hypothetical protein